MGYTASETGHVLHLPLVITPNFSHLWQSKKSCRIIFNSLSSHRQVLHVGWLQLYIFSARKEKGKFHYMTLNSNRIRRLFSFVHHFKEMNDKKSNFHKETVHIKGNGINYQPVTAGRTEPYLTETKPPQFQVGGRRAALGVVAGSPGRRRGCAAPRSAGRRPGPPAAPPAAAAPGTTPRGARRRWPAAGWSACRGGRSSRYGSAQGGWNPGP